MKGIKNKYISLGEIKGNVVITNPSLEERQAISGLMKKDYSKNKTISINLNKLQKQLENSRFCGTELKDIITNYFKEEIVTKKESNERYKEDLNKFFEEILKENENTFVYKYLKNILEEKNKIYYNFKKYYNKEKVLFRENLLNACKGINNLPEQNVRIPVFASNIINNPHGYDKKTVCGTIFIMLLSYINSVPMPRNSEELAELYYNNHLLIDDVSNMVLCRNIEGYIYEKNKETRKVEIGAEHEGLIGFKEYNEPIYLTIYNLSNISCLDKYNKYKKVLITENPAVFMEIVEKCKIKDFPLVCTYGQVKLAGIILLDLLVSAGYQLYYSGDIDPEGIQIADKLKQRYLEKLNFVGFDSNTYSRNISNVEISDMRLKKLSQVRSDGLLEICQKLENNKKVSYEEENIDRLISFIENFEIYKKI